MRLVPCKDPHARCRSKADPHWHCVRRRRHSSPGQRNCHSGGRSWQKRIYSRGEMTLTCQRTNLYVLTGMPLNYHWILELISNF